MHSTACTVNRAEQPSYQRRRPERSTLYGIVQQCSETVFAEAEAAWPDSGGYPKYVKDEVAAYLRCGLMQHGFARFACRACGHERLVAYACKGRGLCPSCVAKRSALTAAHLVDAVLPACDYRQWTLSFPYTLRYRLIRDSRLFARVIGSFVRTVFAWQRRAAKVAGLTDVHCGSVSMVQRYGSVLQVHPHTHTWIPDGVFVAQPDATLRFAPLPPPTDADIGTLCARIGKRVMRRVDGRDDVNDDFSDDEDAVIAQAQADALQSPLQRPLWLDETAEPVGQRTPLSALHGGFSLHAGVRVKANARATLERLLRYGSRPPFAQRRLSVMPSGRVRLELRKPYYTGQTDVHFEPTVFLKRLLAILPPPRWHATRYHGVFSSHHTHRSPLKPLVPKPQTAKAVARQSTPTDPPVMEPEPVPEVRRPSYAQLLSRVFPQDLGACSRCGGTLRLIACIDDPKGVTQILAHLGLPTDSPVAAPARSPPQAAFDDVAFTEVEHGPGDVDDLGDHHSSHLN